MVNATGIVLGVILNFASKWAYNSFAHYFFKEIVIGTSRCTCFPILLAVLYQVLNMYYPGEKATSCYRITLAVVLLVSLLLFCQLK